MKFELKDFLKKNQNVLFLLITLLIPALYAGMMYDKVMPFAEGWYTYYAECINEKGLIPYRDFEYLYPPFYLYFIALVTKVFGYKLIVLRTMGIIMFCLIALGIYLSVQLVSGKDKCWIACIASVTAVFYMQSEVVQTFYDYVRLMDIVSSFSVYYLLKTVQKMTKKEKYGSCLLMTGFLSALLINIKQNVGLIFSAYVVALIIYLGLYYRIKLKETLKNIVYIFAPILAVTLLLIMVLALSGSLPYYIRSTGAGAVSAKGGILAILFGWIPNNRNAFKAGEGLALKTLVLISGVFCINHIFIKRPEKSELKIEKILGLLFGFSIILFFFLVKGSEEFARRIFYEHYLSPYTVFMICCPIFVVFGLWGIRDMIRKEHRMEECILLFTLAGTYFAIAYSCGNSGGISEGQSTLGIALIVTILLLLFYYKWERLARILVVLICFGLTLQTAEKKMFFTYNWWGMDESSYWYSWSAANIPLLEGITMSADTKAVYENIYTIIMSNTTEEDSIYCFPQIPIFYSMCHRSDPGTRSKVQWFDVSTDDTVIQDIEIIQQNKPKVIVMYNTSEYAYQAHENSFRKGQMSGTRTMREFLYNFAYENHYIYAGRFTANSNSIQVWVQNEEEIPPVSVFSGGNGTYENPYLIETADQLLLFSKMVNEGRSFEGSYIRQISDIDLGGLEQWVPIGKFGGENIFCGVYDGTGHVIRNLHVSSTEQDYNLGLFGQLGGKVYNIGLEGGNISGANCGGIASHAFGTNAEIINCYSDISVTANRAGGIADNFAGRLRNVFSVGDLNGVEAADVVSYCPDNAYDIDKLYVLSESLHSQVYNAALLDDKISYCEQEFMSSDSFVNALNEYVMVTNEANSKQLAAGKEIVLVKWKQGTRGHPIFAGE